MRYRPMNRQAGLTMLEVIIASILFSLIALMTSWLIFSATTTVTTTEVNVKMDMDIREVTGTMMRELRQCRRGKFQAMNSAVPIPTDAASMALPASPGVAVNFAPWDPKDPDNTAGTPFVFSNGIRFRIAGPLMELTAVTLDEASGGVPQVPTASGLQVVNGSNPATDNKYFKNSASSDKNGTIHPVTKQPIWNFDLSKFKADVTNNNVEWTYEVTYWWEVQADGLTPEGVANAASYSGFAPDGVDNNNNGVIDEGVIKKMETLFNPDGTVAARNITTIAKDVTSLRFCMPGWPLWTLKDPAGTATLANKYSAGDEKIVRIEMEMQRPDPRTPGKTDFVIKKPFTTYVNVRN